MQWRATLGDRCTGLHRQSASERSPSKVVPCLTGRTDAPGFLASAEEHYEVSPNEAVMIVQGQKRAFTAQEATWVGNLLHVLTGYCIASTFWCIVNRLFRPPTASGQHPLQPQHYLRNPTSWPSGPKSAQAPTADRSKSRKSSPTKGQHSQSNRSASDSASQYRIRRVTIRNRNRRTGYLRT